MRSEQLRDLVEWAAHESAYLLSPVGNRWQHVQGVVQLAEKICPAFDEMNAAHLLAAAHLHDIGYAPQLVQTGFHPLDGARFLRSQGKERLASMVAHHSEARFEAALRHLDAELDTYARERSALADALIYCDLQTGPTGEHISLRERGADIKHRYGLSHIVTIAYNQAAPYYALAIARTNQRLATLTPTRMTQGKR